MSVIYFLSTEGPFSSLSLWERVRVRENLKRFRFARIHLTVGSRTHGRGSFFCAAKRKNPKKRRPDCRLSPPLLAFGGVARRGFHAPLATRGIPSAPLPGYSHRKLRCSARQTGRLLYGAVGNDLSRGLGTRSWNGSNSAHKFSAKLM